MEHYEIVITGSKRFFVEAESEEEALDNPVVSDEMSTMGDVDWDADSVSATLEDSFDIETCRRHKIPVFDQLGEEAGDE